MGWYVNHLSNGTPLANIGKAESLIASGDAVEIEEPFDVDDVGEGRAVLCAIDNGFFEAVGYAYGNDELAVFKNPRDTRPKRWLSMDKELCERLTGFDLVNKMGGH